LKATLYPVQKGLTVTEKPVDIKGDPVKNAFVYLKGSNDGKLKSYDISGPDVSIWIHRA